MQIPFETRVHSSKGHKLQNLFSIWLPLKQEEELSLSFDPLCMKIYFYPSITTPNQTDLLNFSSYWGGNCEWSRIRIHFLSLKEHQFCMFIFDLRVLIACFQVCRGESKDCKSMWCKLHSIGLKQDHLFELSIYHKYDSQYEPEFQSTEIHL